MNRIFFQGEEGKSVGKEVFELVEETLSSRYGFLGFGFFWIWMWFSFQTSFMSAAPERVLMSPSFALDSMLPVFFYVLAFVAWCFVRDLRRSSRRRKAYLAFVLIVASLGNAVCLVASLISGASWIVGKVVYVLGSMATGVGGACLSVEWALHLGRLGAKRTTSVGMCGILFATLLSLVLYFANGLAVVLEEETGVPVSTVLLGVVLALLPFGSMGCMLRAECGMGNMRHCARPEKIKPPWKLVATAFLMGASFGAMDNAAFDVDHSFGFILSIVSLAAGAVLFFVLSVVRRPDYNVLFYKMGFPVMAVGWLAISVGCPLLTYGVVAHSVAYGFVELALWTLMATFIKHCTLPSHLVCSISMVSLTVGRFAGIGAMQFVRSLEANADYGQVCIFLAFLLVVAALYLRDGDDMKAGWGLIRPSSDDVPSSDIEFACKSLALECDLTKQEGNVFLYLAKGRNKTFIAREMVLSPETVKVHMRHIYQKLDVHSQQELMTKVERYLDPEGR